MSQVLLEFDDVYTHFKVHRPNGRSAAYVKAVDGVSLELMKGEVLGLVGESGCGKSTLARTAIQLARATRGAVRFEGSDLALLPFREMRRVRSRIQMVFQDPYASLNPRMTVFDAIAEPLRVHRIVPRSAVLGRVSELMEQVGLARRYMRKYPHEFSGGQRQRVAIARALAVEPDLIIADEPVSALDVSVQAQILNLLADLRQMAGLTMMLISHDLGVVRHLADRIAVMYLGRIVELGDAERVFEHPLHPYARLLIGAIPLADPIRERQRERMLLQGDPPSPVDPPSGCRFHPRCPYATAACRECDPVLMAHEEHQQVACIRLGEFD